MCKLHEIQISVSTNSFPGTQFIPVITVSTWVHFTMTEVSSWDSNHTWYSHHFTLFLEVLQAAVTRLWLLSVSSTMCSAIPHFILTITSKGFTGGSVVKNPAANAGHAGLIPGLGRSPREGNGNPPLYSFWELAWTEEPGGLQSIGLQKSWTWLTNSTTITSKQKEKTILQISCF